FFARWITQAPSVPLYSCTTVAPYGSGLPEIHQTALNHWIQPVEFSRTIERLYADGVRLFVEVGPRGNLTSFVGNILSTHDYAAIPVNVSRRSGIDQLNHLIAHLAAHGVAMTLAPLYAHRRVDAFDLTDTAAAQTPKRGLGPVKIPTGAAEMRLSPEVIDRLRRRVGIRPVLSTVPVAHAAPALDAAPP